MTRILTLLLSGLIASSSFAFEPAPPLPKGPYRGNLFTLPASVTESPALQDNPLPKEPMPEKLTAVPPVLNESKTASSQRPLGPLETLTGKLPKPKASLGTPPPLKPIATINRKKETAKPTLTKKVTGNPIAKQSLPAKPKPITAPKIAITPKPKKSNSVKAIQADNMAPHTVAAAPKASLPTTSNRHQHFSSTSNASIATFSKPLVIKTPAKSKAKPRKLKAIVSYEIGN